MQEINLPNAVAHPLAKYRNHLEFNGYNIYEEGEDWFYSKHPRKPNLTLRRIAERGVLVTTIYQIKENATRSDLLEFINDLNSNFLFMKAFLTDDESLQLDTFFEGEYDRTNFSLLLENFDYDMQGFFNHDRIDEYVP